MTNNEGFKIKKFGPILTDRQDGKKAYTEMIASGEPLTIIDFIDVISLGSSFGDEVLPKLAKQNNNILSIKNANIAIKSCIKKIVEDTGIEILYL